MGRGGASLLLQERADGGGGEAGGEVKSRNCVGWSRALDVSRPTKRLDEDLARRRNRRLTESYPYVIVDAR